MAQGKQIKFGKQATDDKDFVTLDQVVHEEVKEIEWLETTIPADKSSKYIFEDDRVVMVSNPKAPIGGFFTVQGSVPPSLISEGKQVVNVGYMREKARLKGQDVDLESEQRVINMPNPSVSHHGVNKTYCDSNSGKSDDPSLTGLVGFIGGLLGGAASALATLSATGVTSTFGNLAASGLVALGSIANGVLNTGMRVGSAADWANAKPSQSAGTKQLIDNLQDDIANGGSASGDASGGGQLFNGATLFDGMVRMARNAQIGLFELA